MISQFEKCGISNYERIEGVEIQHLSKAENYRNFIKRSSKYVTGTLGCRAAHLLCIQLAKQRGYKNVLILEDDIIFLQDPNVLLNQNQHVLNNWDMLYFGGLVERHHREYIVCAHAYAVRNTLYEDIINMVEPSGMEIDLFYANIIQAMPYKYKIRVTQPFNQIIQNKAFESNIQN